MKHSHSHGEPNSIKGLKIRMLIVGIVFITAFGSFYLEDKTYNQDLQAKEQLVNITNFTLETDPGIFISCRMYIPGNNNTALPAVIIQHGLASKKESMFSMALEFCRRGFVVVTPDLRNHGQSNGYCTLGNKESDDIVKIVNYMWTHINGTYVKDIIGIGLVGHSLGALTVSLAACKTNVSCCIAIAPPPNITQFIERYYNYNTAVLGVVGNFYNNFSNPDYVRNITLIDWVANRTKTNLPRNYLLISTYQDELITEQSVYNMFSDIVNISNPSINKLFGNYDNGTATELDVFPGPHHADEVYTWSAPNITADAIDWAERCILGKTVSAIKGPVNPSTQFLKYNSLEEAFNAMQDALLVSIFSLGGMIIFFMEYYYETRVHLELHKKGVHPKPRESTKSVSWKIARSCIILIGPAFIAYPLYLFYFPFDETALFFIQPMIHALKAITLMWLISLPIIMIVEEHERKKMNLPDIHILNNLGFFYSIKDALYALIIGAGFALAIRYGLSFLNLTSIQDTLIKIPFRPQLTYPLIILIVLNSLLIEGWFRVKIQRRFRAGFLRIVGSALIQGMVMGFLFFLFYIMQPIVSGKFGLIFHVGQFAIWYSSIVGFVFFLIGLLTASTFEYMQSIFAGVAFNAIFIPWIVYSLVPVF